MAIRLSHKGRVTVLEDVIRATKPLLSAPPGEHQGRRTRPMPKPRDTPPTDHTTRLRCPSGLLYAIAVVAMIAAISSSGTETQGGGAKEPRQRAAVTASGNVAGAKNVA